MNGESYGNYWGAGAAYTKLADVRSPAMTMFMIEDSDWRHYNNGSWVVQWNLGAGSFAWVDPLAVFHVNAGSYSYADGHAEIHHWNDATLVAAGNNAADGQASANFSGPLSGPDYNFIHDHYQFPGWK